MNFSYQIYAMDSGGKIFASFAYGNDDAMGLERCKRNFPARDGWSGHYVKNLDTGVIVASVEEVTHLHCADCDEVTLVEELTLAMDGRRLCDLCQLHADILRDEKTELEKAGQGRLFG